MNTKRILLNASSTITIIVNVKEVWENLKHGKYGSTPEFISRDITSNSNTVKLEKDNIYEQVCNVKGELIRMVSNNSKLNELGGRCYYCRRDFTGVRYGYVWDVRYTDDIKEYILDDYMLCGPPCSLAHINTLDETQCKKREYKEHTLNLYGDNSKANDFRLLKSNGGTMDETDWITKYVDNSARKTVLVRVSSFKII